MTAEILSGKEVAESIKKQIANEVKSLNYQPCLIVVRVGEDEASKVYVANKVKTSQELGFKSEHIHFSEDITQTELLQTIDELNKRADVDGILVQLPLPKHIDEKIVLNTILPEKDVDGFNPINVGKLSIGEKSLIPCTPAGVIEILKFYNIETKGKNAVIVGRSNIVGKPMAMLLLQADATVTICHSRTQNLAEITSKADILIAAIGRAGFIKAEHIKQNAVVIDVGINSFSDKELVNELFNEADLEKRINAIEKRGFTLIGDVNQKDAFNKAGKFTPVPGGVGLLTIAMLMKNTLEASKMRRG
jgi:methylenetetrahydrofolate dehydrogenase (NADP+) / methenyltetrahydrofolate cyclohydrolase